MRLRLYALLTITLALSLAGTAQAATTVRSVTARIVPGVTVYCLPLDVQGSTYESDGAFEARIDLSRPTCSALLRLATHTIVNRAASANALETLLHEAHHITMSSINESVVECAALHSLRFWLGRLGYHATAAARLIRLAWLAHWEMPSDYQQGECRSPFPEPAPITISFGG